MAEGLPKESEAKTKAAKDLTGAEWRRTRAAESLPKESEARIRAAACVTGLTWFRRISERDKTGEKGAG